MNPIIAIAAEYGMQFVIEMLKLLEGKPDPTAADFQALVDKYGSKSWAERIAIAQAKVAAETVS